ncbi:hypothetical protein ABZ234_08680 [Nocardiopsis sp. NPDC006198]|uniref:hypothetical protein n=1 Tax=Nocardiopsis sp. NPDC006198 TaxID=3154472 RepID=UPI0033AB0D71
MIDHPPTPRAAGPIGRTPAPGLESLPPVLLLLPGQEPAWAWARAAHERGYAARELPADEQGRPRLLLGGSTYTVAVRPAQDGSCSWTSPVLRHPVRVRVRYGRPRATVHDVLADGGTGAQRDAFDLPRPMFRLEDLLAATRSWGLAPARAVLGGYTLYPGWSDHGDHAEGTGEIGMPEDELAAAAVLPVKVATSLTGPLVRPAPRGWKVQSCGDMAALTPDGVAYHGLNHTELIALLTTLGDLTQEEARAAAAEAFHHETQYFLGPAPGQEP